MSPNAATRARKRTTKVVEPSDGGPGSPGIDSYLGDDAPSLLPRTDVADAMPLFDQLRDIVVSLGRERDTARQRVGEFERAPFVPVGFVAGCEDCAASNDVRPDSDGPGHHCFTCRDVGGEWTPTPHGYDLCPVHLRDLASVQDANGTAAGDALGRPADPPVEPTDLAAALAELRGIVERTGHPALRMVLDQVVGDDDALITDPDVDDPDPNGEAGELSAEQIEALADKLVELLGESGGWVGVSKRWADVEKGAVFLGRKGDLWLVTQAPGAPGEFDKGKVTVKVYGISPSGNPAEYARSFDADEHATILVPAIERDAIGVLRDQLGQVKQVGQVEVAKNGTGKAAG